MRIFGHILYILLGGAVSAWLLETVLDAALPWQVLFVPMLLIGLFISTMGVVNLWLTLAEGDVPMSVRSVVWLYVRCWLVVVMGVALCVVVSWLFGLVESDVCRLVPWLDVAIYSICLVLTAAALLAILRGRSLHEARLLATQNENQLLKAQLNPHFVYNTLNNIDALVWIAPERASKAISELSGMMRYQTYSARRDFVGVGEELRHLREYIDLQQLRLSPGCLSFECSTDDDDALVAPLLVVAVVENCFKHGDFSEPARIAICLSQGVLAVTTDNKTELQPQVKDAESDNRSHGIGMKVLRRRLDVLYPSAYTLEVIDTGGRHHVELRIALDRRPWRHSQT